MSQLGELHLMLQANGLDATFHDDHITVHTGGEELEVEHVSADNTFTIYKHDAERRDTLGSDYDPEVYASGLLQHEVLYAVKGDY